jgi:probable HAF family extracellular repeat protein
MMTNANLGSFATCLTVIWLAASSASAQVSVKALALEGLDGVQSLGMGINQSSQVVGWLFHPPVAGECDLTRVTAFRWTPDDPAALDPGNDGIADGAAVLFLPGCGALTQAFGISDNGHVAGVEQGALFNPSRAAIWFPGGSMKVLSCGDPEFGTARAINDSVRVVGEASTSPTASPPSVLRAWWVPDARTPDDPEEGCRPDNTRLFLPLLPGAELGQSEARDVNNRGYIAGWSDDAGIVSHAVLWNPDGEIIDLGSPFPGQPAHALGINELNQVVGRARDSGGIYRAFMWTPSDPTGNPDPDGNGIGDGAYRFLSPTVDAEAADLNGFGQVVGRSPAESANAVTWDPAGTMTALGGLPGSAGGQVSSVGGINDALHVAGTSWLDAAPFDIEAATLWEIVLGVDVGVAGGGFSTAKNVKLGRCGVPCTKDVTVKLKNFGKLSVSFGYSVSVVSGPPGTVLSAACSGVTAPVAPNKTVQIAGCSVSYSTAGQVTLELAVEPGFGTDSVPSNDLDTATVKVVP